METQPSSISDLGHSVARKTSQIAGNASSAFSELGPEVSATYHHAIDAGKARAAEWKNNFQEGVRHDPIRSLLIAAGVGALLGLILGRQTR